MNGGAFLPRLRFCLSVRSRLLFFSELLLLQLELLRLSLREPRLGVDRSLLLLLREDELLLRHLLLLREELRFDLPGARCFTLSIVLRLLRGDRLLLSQLLRAGGVFIGLERRVRRPAVAVTVRGRHVRRESHRRLELRVADVRRRHLQRSALPARHVAAPHAPLCERSTGPQPTERDEWPHGGPLTF